MNKTVLIITYTFPPYLDSGVFRISKTIKYLFKLGWKIIVITPNQKYKKKIDLELMDDLPNSIKIFKTFSWNPFQFLPTQNYNFSLQQTQSKKLSIFASLIYSIGKIYSFLINLFFLPDHHVLWYFFSKKTVDNVIKKFQPDIIFSSSPPSTVHLLANRAAKKYNIPWATDFRDEWTLNPFKKYSTPLHKFFDKKLESSILHRTNLFITVSYGILNAYKNEYSSLPSKKFSVIFNGFDADDFRKKIQKKSKKFTISYTGNFYGGVSPNVFLKAVVELIRENKINTNDIQIIFAGSLVFRADPAIEYSLLKPILQMHTTVSHNQALKIMQESNVLLLCISHKRGPVSLTGKIFEYFASGNTILALVPKDGDAAKIIREMEAGIICDPDDLVGVKNSLLDLYHQWKNNNFQKKDLSPILNKFSRKEQTDKLDQYLHNAIKKHA